MLSVQITPDRHAYFAGETITLRIRFVNGAVTEEGKTQKGEPRRLGLVGPQEKESLEQEKVQEDREEKENQTPPPKAPIPRHHPHARKVSIAQVPTPTPIHTPSPSSLGTIPEHTPDAQTHVLHDHASAIKSGKTSSTRDVVITFATIQPHAIFTPSPAYIPPEPLLPLRNLLSHQPIGSGHLSPPSATPHGVIDRAAGGEGLTGSLTNLAKGLFAGDQEEGTWDGRKREVWLGRGLAVWIGGREVVGVDLTVGEGEVVDCECSWLCRDWCASAWMEIEGVSR